MAIAFVVAAIGAAAIGLRPGANWSNMAPLLTGATLAAAMTGLVASIMQFLPNRLFSPFTLVAGAVVAIAVFVLLRAGEYMGLERAPVSTAFAWALAAVVALIVSRESGMRLPALRRASRPR
jgi:hypothetical protein